MIVREIIKNNKEIKNFLSNKSDELQLFFLCLAIIIMFAAEEQDLLANYLLFLKLFIPLICFFIITFFVARIIGKKLGFKQDELISLHFTTLARNSPLALAIAVSAFQTQPLILLVLIIGPLMELPILSIISGILRKQNI